MLYSGIMGPPNMSRETVARLNKELVRMVGTPAIKEAWTKQGAEPVGNSPREFAQFIRGEMTKYGKVIRDAGIKPE